MAKFWLVWSEDRGEPTRKHESRGLARAEAERLARQNPGQKFHVLALTGTCVKNDIAWIQPNGSTQPEDEDVPF